MRGSPQGCRSIGTTTTPCTESWSNTAGQEYACGLAPLGSIYATRITRMAQGFQLSQAYSSIIVVLL